MPSSILKYFKPDQKNLNQLTKELGCRPLVAALLLARGISTVQDAVSFLNPRLKDITSPFALKDMDKAVRRIFTAVVNKEKILVFGDFDADGVTATALLIDFLEYCDADVSWYIPHRIKEGYSLAANHVKMAVDQDIDLIITVDCGVSSHEAVRAADLEDIDVIITDHHEPSTTLPPALAVIDPKRNDCSSGLNFLAGVGVVFFLVIGLRKFFREKGLWEEVKEPDLLNYLDLFAIGTIGDMVPLIKENRTLCIAGLKELRQGTRTGLRALARISGINLQKTDSDDISFKIVPRINAAGRISHARICVTQLTTRDRVNAEKTASLLEQLNKDRQTIEREITTDIENRLIKNPDLLKSRFLFLWDDQWDPSVLGIAASKLAGKYTCPVILLSTAGDKAIGSGRSINDINILKALTDNKSLIEKFGGHAMACGLTLEKNNLQTLACNLKQHMDKTYCKKDFQKILTIDAILDFDEINFDLAREIDSLRPYGMSNHEPIFMCENISVASSYLVGNAHRKMVLKKADSTSGHKIDAFHFNITNSDNLPDYYPKIVFRLKINKFKKNSAQIIVQDF